MKDQLCLVRRCCDATLETIQKLHPHSEYGENQICPPWVQRGKNTAPVPGIAASSKWVQASAWASTNFQKGTWAPRLAAVLLSVVEKVSWTEHSKHEHQTCKEYILMGNPTMAPLFSSLSKCIIKSLGISKKDQGILTPPSKDNIGHYFPVNQKSCFM
jgi:hypothetical protein